MGRLSSGCRRCRQRRVRCDEGRPSCQRCIKRNEVCDGYRDESTLRFRDETDKVIEHSRTNTQAASPSSVPSSSSHPSTRKRSSSAGASSATGLTADPSALAPGEASGIRLSNRYPWLKRWPVEVQPPPPPVEEQAVDQFLEKYVLYPCNQTSSPGFLEHLPFMFKEMNVEGRRALRLAVRAAAYADLSKDQEGDALAVKALQCYGMALGALGESLSKPGKVPDDQDLMTVVVLDVFESLYAPEGVKKGSHVQGMAQILRLRGSDLVYSSRGWSLFRLAHHRIQKQQLAYNLSSPISETTDWFRQLDDSEPYVRLEKNALEIGETCKRARELLGLIGSEGLSASTIVDTIQELHSLDQVAVRWRQTSQWDFTRVALSERPDLLPAAQGVTETIQLHPDVWMAYEWNYHRTARMIFLQQLSQCAQAALPNPNLDDTEQQILNGTITECTSVIHWLADEVLATVPQSLGDVDHMGRLRSCKDGPPRCRAIGGYLLLWPIRVIKGEESATTSQQRERACGVFERIRDYTGMKDLLGDKSII